MYAFLGGNSKEFHNFLHSFLKQPQMIFLIDGIRGVDNTNLS